jgi:hypothetical protein
VHGTLATVVCTVALGLVVASSAEAGTLTLRATPKAVAAGGVVTIRSNSGHVCTLTMSAGGDRFRWQLHTRGLRVTIAQGTPAGSARLTARCRHREVRTTFTITAPVSTPTPPVTPTPTPVAAPTPLTVANVCALNPGLGAVTTGNSNGTPYAYWTNAAGAIDIIAYSNNGDAAVDVAAVIDGNQVTYIAYCTQANWTNVAAVEQQAHADPTAPGAQQALLDLDNDAAAIGAINPITPDGPGCAGASAINGGLCEVEPAS